MRLLLRVGVECWSNGSRAKFEFSHETKTGQERKRPSIIYLDGSGYSNPLTWARRAWALRNMSTENSFSAPAVGYLARGRFFFCLRCVTASFVSTYSAVLGLRKPGFWPDFNAILPDDVFSSEPSNPLLFKQELQSSIRPAWLPQTPLYGVSIFYLAYEMNDMGMDMGSSSSSSSMTMLTFLHFFPIGDTIWFKGWAPASPGAVLGACIGFFLLAIVERLLSGLKGISESARRRT